ncbi:MAG: M20/M25/M40 family metallo-hydrolase [Sphingomonas adhaesiva]|uniref:M20/M25/M40 family metallo-hydrolase n=1 Tax=Sphingomonas adhaesiva TaxID=28212 RepID=UPI002FFC85C1
MRHLATALLACVAALPATAQPRDYVADHQGAILAEYVTLLAIPNVASDTPDIRRNAAWLMAKMRGQGLSPRLLEGPDATVPPAVYGEWIVPGASRTYVLYAHYDGQPVTPADWTSTRPFEPRLYTDRLDRGGKPVVELPTTLDPEWRLYGRSASDDKAGVMAILTAIDALKAQGKRPAFNLKIVFEGEEEAGSPHLAAILDRHRTLLASDGWIIFDGPENQSEAKQVVLGVRGVVGVNLTVYGPARPLHSGHYGNWAPNPAMQLAQLLASMKDRSGRVTIKGFYDDVTPLTPAERAMIDAVPNTDARLKRDLGLATSDGGGRPVAAMTQLPSLSVTGLRSADVGDKARNVIPASATAALDMRLVAGNDHQRQYDRLVAHIRAQGFFVVDHAPTPEERRAHGPIAFVSKVGGYNAERTALDHPLATAVIRAVRRRHADAIVLPSIGGSLPLYVLRDTLAAPSVTVALANHDNNQHAEDENLRLRSLWDAIRVAESIMTLER